MLDKKSWPVARKPIGRAIRWFLRSGHRVMLTKNLRQDIEAMSGTVLDVGGGRASPLTRFWTPSVHRIRLDLVAGHRPDVQADAAKIPARSASVDGVLLSEVLEHLPEPQAVVDEVYRVLKPGSALAGSVPFLAQGIHGDPFDYYRYTEQALARLLIDFDEVLVRPHGNGFGVAWRMIGRSAPPLRVLNPAARQLSRIADPVTPEGYTFRARKPR